MATLAMSTEGKPGWKVQGVEARAQQSTADAGLSGWHAAPYATAAMMLRLTCMIIKNMDAGYRPKED